MTRTIVNKYANGEINIFLNSESVTLYPDNTIVFTHWGSEGEADYQFDLLADVGRVWIDSILEILEIHDIVVESRETETNYCSFWVSHNIKPYNPNLFKDMNPDNTKNINTKDEAIEFAKEYQEWASEQNLSWGELAEWTNELQILAIRFGLTEEFSENGII